MSETVINVENLSKRYLVGHRSPLRERYSSLRDVIAREARNFARKAIDGGSKPDVVYTIISLQ